MDLNNGAPVLFPAGRHPARSGRLDRVRQLTDPAHPVTVTHWLAVHRTKTRSVTKASEAADLSKNDP
jgi:hypothetical protein